MAFVMTKQNLTRNRFGALLCAGVILWAIPVPPARAQSAPDIKITEVPPATGGGPSEVFPISGLITGLNSNDYKN